MSNGSQKTALSIGMVDKWFTNFRSGVACAHAKRSGCTIEITIRKIIYKIHDPVIFLKIKDGAEINRAVKSECHETECKLGAATAHNR